jgi:putative heme iron utilization protein
MATAMDGRPILLLSTLADHTKNLGADNRGSILIEDTEGHANPQTGPRVSLLGEIEPSDDPDHRARFLARHPAAKLYAGFADFRFHVMTIRRVHFVGGFARAVWYAGARIHCSQALAKTFAEAEPEILDHMNGEHADAVALYGQKLLNRRGRHWRLIGADPWGLDLRCGQTTHRLDFEKPVDGIGALRAELVRLAKVARAQ